MTRATLRIRVCPLLLLGRAGRRESYLSISAKWSGTTPGNMTSAPLKVDEPGHTQNPGVSAASVGKGGEAGTSSLQGLCRGTVSMYEGG